MDIAKIPEVKDFPELRLSVLDITPIIAEGVEQSFNFCRTHHIAVAANKDYTKVLLHFILLTLQKTLQTKTKFPKAFVYFKNPPRVQVLWNSIKKTLISTFPALFDVEMVAEVKGWEDPDLISLLQRKVKRRANILRWLKKEGLLELSHKGLLLKKWGELKVA
jgi:hypothetical protein